MCEGEGGRRGGQITVSSGEDRTSYLAGPRVPLIPALRS
jgi:hypothetical protein